MDWYSWLSRTTLETSLLYEYNLVFTQNELQKEDIIYFTHEFLQSLGITVAKHRLEILKLVHKDLGKTPPNGFVKLVLAFKKTKKLFTKWISHKKNSAQMLPFELSNYSKQYSGPLRRLNIGKECKNVTRSGPLDRGMLEQMMISDKWISISGPLDGKLCQEKCMSTNRSPTLHGHTDGKWKETLVYGNKSPITCRPWQGRSPSPLANHFCGDGNLSPWSLMFQDMKPT